MEDIYKLIDDINLQKLDHLDTRVNEALTSNNDDALFILGETLYNFGLTPQGLEVFRTLYHKYPDESELLIYFIEGLMSENQTDEALEYLNQVELSPEKLMLEADLYQQINMTEVAIDKLTEARELEPNDPIIHFALAELLYFDGQYLRATREYEVVLDTGEYEINGINLFSRMADCALQSGNYSDAIQLFDEISEDEMISDDFFKKAIAYEKNDLTQEAIKIMTTLLSKDPDFIKASSARLLRVFSFTSATLVIKSFKLLNSPFSRAFTIDSITPLPMPLSPSRPNRILSPSTENFSKE